LGFDSTLSYTTTSRPWYFSEPTIFSTRFEPRRPEVITSVLLKPSLSASGPTIS
jgi:hypothetical protein